MISKVSIPETDLFHVHTYRCQHADEVPDEDYVLKAIQIGVTGIWFTDHAPFPGNRFHNRMLYEELEEYIESILNLKEKYEDRIHIHLGMEIEYLSEYDREGYYDELLNDDRFEVLMLGQHMAEDAENPRIHTFDWDKERLKNEEYKALMGALTDGICTGKFNIVAHPDRSFRRCKKWTDEMSDLSEKLIDKAKEHNMPLEINMHSLEDKHHFWPEFWDIAKEKGSQIIIGLDAHSPGELDKRRVKSEPIARRLKNGESRISNS